MKKQPNFKEIKIYARAAKAQWFTSDSHAHTLKVNTKIIQIIADAHICHFYLNIF